MPDPDADGVVRVRETGWADPVHGLRMDGSAPLQRGAPAATLVAMNMKTIPLTRRQFMEQSLALTGAATILPRLRAAGSEPTVRTAIDRVPLGSTGLRPSRLGMGTGVNNGEDQMALGKEGFIRLIHEAYDRGIRYFDCAGRYRTFPWMADALKGLPREDLFITSKIWGAPDNPTGAIEHHLRNFKTEYIDCMLLHCATRPDWTDRRQSLIDAMMKAKEAGTIRAIGVSCHTLPALRVASRATFIDVNLVRINPQCAHTDRDPNLERGGPGDITPVLTEIRQMKANGNGIIGMKLIGNGDFRNPEDRERSIQFAMSQPELDAVTIGFVNAAQIDEAMERINRALATT